MTFTTRDTLPTTIFVSDTKGLIHITRKIRTLYHLEQSCNDDELDESDDDDGDEI